MYDKIEKNQCLFLFWKYFGILDKNIYFALQEVKARKNYFSIIRVIIVFGSRV